MAGARDVALGWRYGALIVDNTLAPDRVLGGRYRLRGELARGGMATVWEAEDRVLNAVTVQRSNQGGRNGPDAPELSLRFSRFRLQTTLSLRRGPSLHNERPAPEACRLPIQGRAGVKQLNTG